MAEKTLIHIADDPDLLEEFVMGRLSGAENESVVRHAASCGRCAQAIRSEQMLAAGTKSLGRAILKENLRRKLVQTPALAARPWPRILSAAAVLVILAGVGWLNHWFLAPAPEPALVSDRLAPATVPGPADKDAAPRSTAEAHPERDGVKERADSPRPPEYAAKAEAPMRSAEESRPTLRNEKADGTAEKARTTVVTGQDVTITAGTAATEERFWVEGNAIAEAPALLAAETERKDEVQMKRKSAAQGLGKMERGAAPAAGTAAQSTQNYRVLQRSSTALPAPRQNKQQANALRPVVQTLVEQRGEETVMTLYLDSLLDQQELRNATVQRIADDSLIVNIGHQKIGYRWPAKNQLQQNTGK